MSTVSPHEEVIAPDPYATGWVRKLLTIDELAGLFDIPSHVKANQCDQLAAWKLFGQTLPRKIADVVTQVFNEEDSCSALEPANNMDIPKEQHGSNMTHYLTAVKADYVKMDVNIWNQAIDYMHGEVDAHSWCCALDT
eukprot:10033377-Ditylum_brightwellii.AAC.1